MGQKRNGRLLQYERSGLYKGTYFNISSNMFNFFGFPCVLSQRKYNFIIVLESCYLYSSRETSVPFFIGLHLQNKKRFHLNVLKRLIRKIGDFFCFQKEEI